ncbi:hypothetical protein Ciccas_009448, partial [Cichlidogyrus casuarinus]
MLDCEGCIVVGGRSSSLGLGMVSQFEPIEEVTDEEEASVIEAKRPLTNCAIQTAFSNDVITAMHVLLGIVDAWAQYSSLQEVIRHENVDGSSSAKIKEPWNYGPAKVDSLFTPRVVIRDVTPYQSYSRSPNDQITDMNSTAATWIASPENQKQLDASFVFSDSAVHEQSDEDNLFPPPIDLHDQTLTENDCHLLRRETPVFESVLSVNKSLNCSARLPSPPFVLTTGTPKTLIEFLQPLSNVHIHLDRGSDCPQPELDLQCSLSLPVPAALVKWLYNGSTRLPLLLPTATFDSKLARLRASRLRPEYSGIYACEITDPINNCTAITQCFVNIEELPGTDLKQPSNEFEIDLSPTILVEEGGSAVLECKLSRNVRLPAATTPTWVHNGVPMIRSGLFDGRHAWLALLRCRLEDSGSYHVEFPTDENYEPGLMSSTCLVRVMKNMRAQGGCARSKSFDKKEYQQVDSNEHMFKVVDIPFADRTTESQSGWSLNRPRTKEPVVKQRLSEITTPTPRRSRTLSPPSNQRMESTSQKKKTDFPIASKPYPMTRSNQTVELRSACTSPLSRLESATIYPSVGSNQVLVRDRATNTSFQECREMNSQPVYIVLSQNATAELTKAATLRMSRSRQH